MEVFVKSFNYDNQKFVLTKLTLDDTRALRFSAESFRANFLHPSYPLYLGSYEDLVLMDNEKRQVVLYNPTTDRVKFLPPTTIQAMPRSDGEKCDTNYNCTGFGKDYATGDFKVIRNVVTDYETLDGRFIGCSNRYEVYSLLADAWREIQVPADDDNGDVMLSAWASIYVDGVYYWPTYVCNNGGVCAIRSFDFSTESFSTIPRPPITSLAFSTFLVEVTGVGEFHGESCLGCIVFELSGESKHFELWSWRRGPEPEWVLLDKFVLRNVDQPTGFVQGRYLFLEQSLNPNLYRLKVYDILAKKLQSLDLYDNTNGMRVVSYIKNMEGGATRLPKSKKLSACNKASYWNNYWEAKLKEEEEENEEEEEEATCSSSDLANTAFYSQFQLGPSYD